MSDILFQCLCWQAFRYSWKSIQQPLLRNTIGAATFFALAMLTKPVAFLLGFTVCILLLATYIKKKSVALLWPFFLLPLCYHSLSKWNEHTTGYYHYSSVGPFFVLKYMAKYTNAQVYGEAYADRAQDSVMAIANSQKTFKGRCEQMNNAGIAFIKQNLPTFIYFNVKGWIAFLIDPGRFDWVHFLQLNESGFPGLYHLLNTQGFTNGMIQFLKQAPIFLLILLGISLIWNCFTVYALLVLLLSPKFPMWLRILLLLFIAYIIASTGVLGLARYRIAVAPLLWLCVISYFTSFGLMQKKNA